MMGVFGDYYIGIPVVIHYPLVVGEPSGEVTGLKFQDGGHICLCCRANGDAEETKTLIDTRWGNIVMQFAGEIEASSAIGTAAGLEEQPGAGQVGWHARPEIGEPAI